MIRVAHADDHKVVRLGLEQLLETFDDVEPWARPPAARPP